MFPLLVRSPDVMSDDDHLHQTELMSPALPLEGKYFERLLVDLVFATKNVQRRIPSFGAVAKRQPSYHLIPTVPHGTALFYDHSIDPFALTNFPVWTREQSHKDVIEAHLLLMAKSDPKTWRDRIASMRS